MSSSERTSTPFDLDSTMKILVSSGSHVTRFLVNVPLLDAEFCLETSPNGSKDDVRRRTGVGTRGGCWPVFEYPGAGAGTYDADTPRGGNDADCGMAVVAAKIFGLPVGVGVEENGRGNVTPAPAEDGVVADADADPGPDPDPGFRLMDDDVDRSELVRVGAK
ncbi:hypothetical protein HDU93_000642 [Gonapodya sp. JEL0774]|nr:hypothetical protein HDU93_000642 [Gonapodya sp. JEL0774]